MTRAARNLCLVLLVAFATGAPSAHAGLFKNLLTKIGGAMETTNQAYWTGENSVGNTTLQAIKGKKGNFFQAFDAIAGSVKTAQEQVLASVKAVWEAVKDIILWLPRKIKAAFEKAVQKLNTMNQGGSVKERWNSLVGAGGGGGGGARIQSFGGMSSPAPEAEPAPAPEPAETDVESGPMLEDDLESLLSDDESARGSMSRDEALRLYGESVRASADAPSAPGSMVEFEGYGEVMDMTGAIDDGSNKEEARKRIRLYYLVTLDAALTQNDLPRAAGILKAGPKMYLGNPSGMQKAMGKIARRHPKHSRSIEKVAKRHANLASRGQ